MNFEEANNIPGMIELVERSMLYSTLKSIPLEKNDCIIEFGPFFGRSTNCIAQGLVANDNYFDNCKIYTYDSFQCDEQGWFAPHVLGAAKTGNVEKLIKHEDKKIDFERVFVHYLRPYIDSKTINYIKSELNVSVPPNKTIAFMHIDAPKYYEELKVILNKFFPKTKIGSVIVFQDFFYQWSATLILSVAILIEKKIISIEQSAASSLVCRVLKIPSKNDIIDLDKIMQDENQSQDYFDVAISSCKKIKLDRPEAFLPKITLAKIQWQYSKGYFNESRKTIVKYIRDGNPFQLKLLDIFLELLGNGFSIRHLFEKDYSNDNFPKLADAGKFEVERPKNISQ